MESFRCRLSGSSLDDEAAPELPVRQLDARVTARLGQKLRSNRGRVHKVTAIGAIAILATQALRGPLATTRLWHDVATFAIRLAGS